MPLLFPTKTYASALKKSLEQSPLMTVAVPVRLQGGSSECNRPAPPDEDESGSDEDNLWHELLKVHVPDGANQAAKVSLNQSHHPAGATNLQS
jgi:hypothetical protein